MAKNIENKKPTNPLEVVSDVFRKIPVKRLLACDQSYSAVVGVNYFGHLQNQITLLNKVNEDNKQKYLDMLMPVPEQPDGTENLSLRKAFDACKSRYAQTPLEVAAEYERISKVLAPEEKPLENVEESVENSAETPETPETPA